MEHHATPSLEYAHPAPRPGGTMHQTAHGKESQSAGVKEPYAKTSNPNFSLRRAHSVAQSKNISDHGSSPAAGPTGAYNYVLQRGSNEMTGQKSLKRYDTANSIPDPERIAAREGRQFTVANVGNNGNLYLRPMNNTYQTSSSSYGYSQPQHTLRIDTHLQPTTQDESNHRYSVWSISQLSGFGSNVSDIERQETQFHKPIMRRPTSRRHSISTIDSQHSGAKPPGPGELRIVIERPKTGESKSHHRPMNSLETPIPNYRLGDFRFTTEGAAMLRSSEHTGTSGSDNNSHPTLPRSDGVSPMMLNVSRRTQSLVSSLFPACRSLSGYATTQTQSTVFYKLKEPIEPSIYDALGEIMDDPSVVRYAKGTKNLAAATPARIVAQISSDFFMDYELVSDFFLTFRSYLSSSNLLSLLLARLEWAINRLKDDGRIIRIRVFAALRHWILNYFVDDFVTNYELRSQFCDRTNRLYESVKNRGSNDASDLKIILDLKKCWNGRYALYWGTPEFTGVSQPDDLVIPGGNPSSPGPGPATNAVGQLPYSELPSPIKAPLHKTEEAANGLPPKTATEIHSARRHIRQESATSSHDRPVSPTSVKTAYPISCYFPTKPPRRNGAHPNRAKGQHPVPVPIPAVNSPSSPSPLSPCPVSPLWRRPFHSHKRSGSFSDSVRDDRAPLPHPNNETNKQFRFQRLQTTSIIRGNVFAPVDPYITTVNPPSPTFNAGQMHARSPSLPARPGSSPKNNAPAVKTFIGSIRRALQPKPGSNNPAVQTGFSHGLHQGKTSQLPSNVVFGADTYRDKMSGFASKNNGRVDALSRQTLQSYHELVAKTSERSDSSDGVPASNFQLQREGRPYFRLDPVPIYSRSVSATGRIHSQMSNGSKSIVIVDDTGTSVQLMPEQIHMLFPVDTDGTRSRRSRSDNDLSSAVGSSDISRRGRASPLQFFKPSESLEQRETRHLFEPPLYSPLRRSLAATPNGPGDRVNRLRRCASDRSGMGKHDTDSDANSTHRNRNSTRISTNQHVSRILRRRPGGNLRQMQLGNDIGQNADALTFLSDATGTDSMSGSALYIARASALRQSGSHADDYSDSGIISQRYSLIRPHSTPQTRASFEATVAGFSKIPDEGDGGVASTLLKLEGKWQKQSIGAPQVIELEFSDGPRAAPERGPALRAPFTPEKPEPKSNSYSESFGESEDSCCSIPLLERGLSDESMKTPIARRFPRNIMQTSPKSQNDQSFRSDRSPSHPSIEMVEKTESLNRITQGSTAPRTPTKTDDSYIRSRDEQNDNASEISSEISVDIISGSEGGDDFNVNSPNGSPRTKFSQAGSTHPLATPLTPPTTIPYPGSTSSYIGSEIPKFDHPNPITPQVSPTSKNVKENYTRSPQAQHAPNNPRRHPELDIQSPPPTAISSPDYNHVPFILAFDSDILAQQFTIVEQAALNEVDWKDLVDMRWSHSSQSTLNWVDYLAEHERKGIDMVVARFNLMVKWAISEIILTKNTSERVKTITKLIHVAVRARRLRNYATMLQIAIALSSVDCTRLTKTWARVPEPEKQLLRDMESLIQPIRNFHNLRLEMESSIQDGCIPFVGLYIQDLTYNAQKPAQIASTREGEPLVNFERYHTTAAIVKSLLRLIDASTKYEFEPISGIIERCLWVAALPDENIMSFSKMLE